MNEFDIADAFPFDKAIEVFFNDKAPHLPCRGDRKTRLSVFGFDFDNQRTQHVNPKGLA